MAHLTRGYCGYGSETNMLEHERRGLPYLFKLRHTTKVKELVNHMMRLGERWQDCGDGWQGSKPPSGSVAGPRKGESSSCGKTWPRLLFEKPANPAAAEIARPSCLTPKVPDGTPRPPPGAARSPFSSLPCVTAQVIPKHYRDRTILKSATK